MSQQSLPVKLFVNDECRRFGFSGSTFTELKNQCLKVAGIEENNNTILQYTDDEGDMVTFSSDVELGYAIASVKAPQLLRIRLKVKETAQLPSSTPVPPTREPGTDLCAESLPFVPASDQWRTDRRAMKIARREAKWQMKENRRNAEGSWRRGGQARPAKEFKVKEFDSRFVTHVNYDDGAEVPSGTQFQKTWRFRNCGSSSWPQGTLLVRVDRANELSSADYITILSQPAAGEEVDVSITLTAPLSPGMYTSYFKLCAPFGKKFGQRMRCQILSVEEDRLKVWETLESMGFVKPGERPQHISSLIVQEKGDINSVVRLLVNTK